MLYNTTRVLASSDITLILTDECNDFLLEIDVDGVESNTLYNVPIQRSDLVAVYHLYRSSTYVSVTLWETFNNQIPSLTYGKVKLTQNRRIL